MPSATLPAPLPARSHRLRTGLYALAALLLTAGVVVALQRVHLGQLREAMGQDLGSVSWLKVAFGIGSIYVGLFIRAVRWALLMAPEQRPKARTLFAPQFAGFAAVALFGRVADLARPYLCAKRTGTPTAEQIAIYSVERALDLAATATLFSVMLLLVPRSTPHHASLVRAGIAASAATAFLLTFALLVRSRGDRVAAFIDQHLASRAPRLSAPLAARVRDLQAGFASLRSLAQFAAAFGWSLVIWFGIALSYLFSAHSITDTPELTSLHLSSILILMATSMGASLLQLPVVGWFTQIAALAAAYHGFFGVPPAAATLCGAITFLGNTFCVIPTGFLFARFSGLSLREARSASRETALA